MKIEDGSGSALNRVLLIFTGLSTLIATAVSAMSIYLHLKNYRKPYLQRMVIRIMVMVPLYATSSLIALFSLEAAFVIDAIRDIYEAFVIYCFFHLLIAYMGGERSLLILLQGRSPKDSVFPLSIFSREVDLSDPYTFLFMKRGILQYVQVKPILAVVTLILKAIGKYHEGNLAARSGYLYVSIVYNLSICLSLYCLAMFWMCINDDLKPFRPMPKFLCVKGILFFSFWQSIVISILVAAGFITKLGPYTDSQRISLGLNDSLTCFEMPLFAIAHLYAFSYTDFVDPKISYVARMPIKYAFKDAFGIKDVVEDSKATLRGENMDYREFESSEGFMHQGLGRERRIRAGLRYSQGGKKKYWLPQPVQETTQGPVERGFNRVLNAAGRRQDDEEVYAPLLEDAADVVHNAPDLQSRAEQHPALLLGSERDEGFELPFGELDEVDEELFSNSKQYLFGDYNYPCIDASSEVARKAMWEEEERILSNERGAYFSSLVRPRASGSRTKGYGAVGTQTSTPKRKDSGSSTIINKAHDGVSNLETDEVRLKGANAKAPRQSSPSYPRAQALTGKESKRSAESPSSLPSSINSVRANRSSVPSTSHIQKRPILPPDAVDLIVKDEEMAHEVAKQKRTSDPAAHPHGGLRNVYRRGYLVEDSEGYDQGEMEIGDEQNDSRGMKEGIVDEIEQGVDVVISTDVEERLFVVEDEDETVVMLETPPPHAILDRSTMNINDDDNPWAW